ncbi:hypothetical protein CONLIGDRAFT_408147 [Coniochaeta ligniaria NRRL 30616]|uniref:Uncharacterized protein n=1 Tax=Coniochaeta ligniaria NRRL 30616 TaxID=1408157 RepID=A0A1J7JN43_9PEZI|nr:hypothetical protein CONLIGDRAFT_408147 [Coniochaeta ligniaria NRRL 30616]
MCDGQKVGPFEAAVLRILNPVHRFPTAPSSTLGADSSFVGICSPRTSAWHLLVVIRPSVISPPKPLHCGLNMAKRSPRWVQNMRGEVGYEARSCRLYVGPVAFLNVQCPFPWFPDSVVLVRTQALLSRTAPTIYRDMAFAASRASMFTELHRWQVQKGVTPEIQLQSASCSCPLLLATQRMPGRKHGSADLQPVRKDSGRRRQRFKIVNVVVNAGQPDHRSPASTRGA